MEGEREVRKKLLGRFTRADLMLISLRFLDSNPGENESVDDVARRIEPEEEVRMRFIVGMNLLIHHLLRNGLRVEDVTELAVWDVENGSGTIVETKLENPPPRPFS